MKFSQNAIDFFGTINSTSNVLGSRKVILVDLIVSSQALASLYSPQCLFQISRVFLLRDGVRRYATLL